MERRPIAVSTDMVFGSIAAGAWHTCALTDALVLYCWGDNRYGELGDGTRVSRATPVAIVTPAPLVSLALGRGLSCGLTATGQAYCWGQNATGAVGDGTSADRLVPTPVAGGFTFSMLAVQGGDAVCGLTTSGAAYCWGSNAFGALGDGSGLDHATPTAVAGGRTFVEIAAGVNFACARTAAGRAYCWGRNEVGQLGDGSTTARATPVAVASTASFASLWSGQPLASACGISTESHVLCWGGDLDFELGAGAWDVAGLGTCNGAGFAVPCARSPVAVYGGRDFSQVVVGQGFACALDTRRLGNGAWCWGRNDHGQLGIDWARDHSEYPGVLAM